eukprot:g35429.t1
MWKLNVKVLTSENIEELKRDHTRTWRTMKSLFESPADWWEAVKGNIKRFFILKGVQRDLRLQHTGEAGPRIDELTKDLEPLEKNKTPRSNGLLAKLYSALWDLIGQDLLVMYDSTLLEEPFAESIRKDVSLRGVTNTGSGGLQVKASLSMDDITVFCSDPPSRASVTSSNWPWEPSHLPFHVETEDRPCLQGCHVQNSDKLGKNVPNIAITLMATFQCCCIKLCVDP